MIENYEKYGKFIGCKEGETIASIGAGNGRQGVQISCVINGITWYLEEIDASRLYEFDKVLAYHQKIKGTPISADFHLVLGEGTSTLLPKGIFDRVIMINVFHEISNRKPIMLEIKELLNDGGELVIMERMGSEAGQKHKDCKHPKLFEPDFLSEMSDYGFEPDGQVVGEKVSALTYYTFTTGEN